ncbi:1-aminocyclopropane-1-carboxylate oxidase-like 1-like [Melia azedarach]|uniref:1-aminocyclopropane-1-carboxylate oxidase-like 1-like n=1 Tax=Melia azedarach TaxID=155640 RepID=A0ACC1XI61_MELAZ|nr:1-aminocyclopropane-1-carboxylate oxidase-like 1-like [Melia azedarach]
MATVKESYDRAKEVKQFEDSKLGVKGLVDSGITSIPRFFVLPPDALSGVRRRPNQDVVPIIDLSGVDSDLLRPTIVENVARASRELGIFQVVNHGIGVDFLERVLGAIGGFHEQPPEAKALLYRRDLYRVSFFTDLDIAPGWRDTIRMVFGLGQQDVDEIPEIIRNEVVEFDQRVTKVGEVLMGLLCEGLGVKTERLKEMTFLQQRSIFAHYYSYCPQPDLTLGTSSHTDAGGLTILFQDQKGGLQAKYGEDWVDVKPVPGALVVNIGDALQVILYKSKKFNRFCGNFDLIFVFQIVSNDEYRSAEHRVLANSSQEPRISAAVFFNPGDVDSLYGPLPELISTEKPARFRQFTFTEYRKRFMTKDLDGKSLVNYYSLSE